MVVCVGSHFFCFAPLGFQQVITWSVPASKYITWLETTWGGTTPGIVTNIRVGYNDTSSEPWPPLNQVTVSADRVSDL